MSAELDVASYLAQRKAKKSGKGKFKTFTATAAFMAMGGEEEVLDDLNDEYDATNAVAPAHVPTPNENTLVAGEWIDDDSQLSDQPRLIKSGVQVGDLETFSFSEQEKKSNNEKVQNDDSKKSTKSAEPVKAVVEPVIPAKPSAWGNPDVSKPPTTVWNKVEKPVRPEASETKDQPPPPSVAAEKSGEKSSAPKSNVWKPNRSIVEAPPSAGPSTSLRSPPPTVPTAAPPKQPVLVDGRDANGLKRSANAWRPKNLQ